MLGRLVGLTLTLSMLTPWFVYAPESADVDGWEHRLLRERSTEPRKPLPPIPEPRANQLKALRIFTEKGDWGENDWESLLELWHRESSWRHRAQNPRSTARGLPQAMGSLNPKTMTDEWLNDPEAQIRWGLNYIRNRYGTVANALAHHDKKGWY